MDVDDVVEFLTWLEWFVPVKLEFKDKQTLAEQFREQRADRLYREWQQR